MVLMRKCFWVALLLLSLACSAAANPSLRVDGERLNDTIEKVKTFGLNENGGSDRIAFSQHNIDSLRYLTDLMEAAGLEVRTDFAGNLIGSHPGRNPQLAPIVTGSHIDTVPNGGHYDGIAGVMAAIEVARTLHQHEVILAHPLEVVVWSNEEGGKTGSRSISGTVGHFEMGLPSFGRLTLGEGLRALGGDPDRLTENARQPNSVAGYIELHVEQGAILDREGIDIGIVEGIVGIKRWYVQIDGFANHAGTTPMDQRQDAMLAAAKFVVAVNQIATGVPGRQVATVGKIAAQPDTPNVIAGRVDTSLEIRDLKMEKVDRLYAQIEKAMSIIAAETGTEFKSRQYYESPAADANAGIMADIENAIGQLELTSIPMPSGAGHDAQSFKGLAPLGMIFVPSQNGISHAPSEYVKPEHITNGANVLLHTILGMDASLADN